MEFITSDLRIAVENFYIGRIYTITFKDSSSITRACIGKGADYVMFQDTAPKMLFTLNMQTAATVDTIEPGTGSGTYDYDDLENKPQINSVTLSGNKSSSDLGLQDAISSEDPLPANYVSGLATVATTGAYSDLSGLPTLGSAAAADASDFATAAQGSKADAADSAISTAATGYASLDARLDSMDTIISGKQAALTESQLDAVNSGIDSTKVAQIETNKNNISFVASQGRKNVLKFDSVGSGAYSGITYTVNDDGTVRASGTASALSYEYLRINNSNLDAKKYTNGQFVLSGCPSGGGSDTYSLYAAKGNYAKFDYGDGVILTPTSELEVFIVLRVEKDQTVDIVFKPMIRLIGTDSTFEPYALSNAELTAAIQAIQAQLANQ